MNRMAKFRGLILVVGAIGLTTSAFGQGSTAAFAAQKTTKAMQKLIKDAQREGAINIVEASFSGADFLNAVASGMKKEYGVSIKITNPGGPSMARMTGRLIQEHRAHRTPSSDLIYTSQRQRLRLKQAGVTGTVDWKSYDPTLRKGEITSYGTGVISFADRVCIVYNTKAIPSNMVPKTLWDLADPKYKGRIATTPYGTGWAEAALLFGSDRVKKFATKVSSNIAGYTGSTDFDPVITGQMPIFAFSGAASNALSYKAKGAPIDVVFPFQSYFLFSIEVLKGSAHENAARLLALFLHTPEGQKILWKYRHQDSPFVPTSHEYKQVQAAKAAGHKVLLYTEEDVVKHKEIFKKLVPSITKMIRRR